MAKELGETKFEYGSKTVVATAACVILFFLAVVAFFTGIYQHFQESTKLEGLLFICAALALMLTVFAVLAVKKFASADEAEFKKLSDSGGSLASPPVSTLLERSPPLES